MADMCKPKGISQRQITLDPVGDNFRAEVARNALLTYSYRLLNAVGEYCTTKALHAEGEAIRQWIMAEEDAVLAERGMNHGAFTSGEVDEVEEPEIPVLGESGAPFFTVGTYELLVTHVDTEGMGTVVINDNVMRMRVIPQDVIDDLKKQRRLKVDEAQPADPSHDARECPHRPVVREDDSPEQIVETIKAQVRHDIANKDG